MWTGQDNSCSPYAESSDNSSEKVVKATVGCVTPQAAFVPAEMVDCMKTQMLTFQKSGHTFLFRYTGGQEQGVVDEIMALAQDPRCCLDWVDAATLSFQVVNQVVSGSHAPMPNAKDL